MIHDNFRKEKDSLGELQVPAAAYYGVQTQRAVDNFPISGLHPWRAFVWSIAAVKRAAALVNFETLKKFKQTSGASPLPQNNFQTQSPKPPQKSWTANLTINLLLTPFKRARGRVTT